MALTDEQWRRAWEIYRAASELGDEERRTYLASVSADPEVFEQLVLLMETPEPETVPAPGLQPGSPIGHYAILGELGRGGMGQIYLARDTELERKVALKLLAPEWIATRPAVEGLIREAKAASALNHPHIVTVYEVVRSGNDVAIAMELVEGEALRAYCCKAQPIAHVIRCGRQIAQALAAAHRQNIVHGDIKPENLMIRDDGHLKVLDFGLARQLTAGKEGRSSTASGILAGTLNYMAPEQTRAERPSSASDVFSLGVVLFELATGKHPFLSDSPIDTAHAIAHVSPKPPRLLNKNLPDALNSLLLAMLAKDPGARPSAAEVEEKLSLIESPPIQKRTWGFRWLAAAIVAASIAGGWALWRMRTPNASAKEPVMIQVTRQASENRVTAAALSPNGKQLAFAALGEAIWLRRMSDGFTSPVPTPMGLKADRISWFADGSRLLVSGAIDGGNSDIWTIPVNGGHARLVVANGKDGVPAPDGTRIAWISLDGSAIWVTPPKGGRAHRVRLGRNGTSFSSLVWSPHSQRIAYQRREPRRKDARSERSTGEIAADYNYSYESADVTTGQVTASVPNFVMNSACELPDGRILFLRWEPPAPFKHRLWEVQTDPRTGRILGSARELTHRVEPLDVQLLSISASNDGREVAAVRRISQPNVYIADLQPGAPAPRLSHVRRLTFTEADEFPHTWTADSQAVIFESNRNGHFQLFRQNIGQTAAQPLVLAPEDNVLAQLSPDGKWILYIHWNQASGNRELMRVAAAGGTPRQLTKIGAPAGFRCGLRADAGCVTRTAKNGQFVFRALDPLRGEGRVLAREPWIPQVTGDWSLSPDSSEAAIPNHDPQSPLIRLVTLRGRAAGKERTIRLRAPEHISGVVWAANGRGLYVSIQTSSGGLLLYANLNGQTWKLLKSGVPTYAVPSPDGRHIAFPEWTTSSNVWQFRGL
ncbi:MAG: protein kinase domain-containing protein [Bryobacteraceae bacterium]